MTEDNIYTEIINDLKRDFPDITSITKKEKEIIIKADENTLWEIYETLYKGIENLELNLGKNEESHIILRI